MPQQKKGIYIGIPSRDGKLTVGLVRMIARALHMNHETDCPYFFRWAITPGLRPTEYARNVLVRAFLESDCERLFFVDDDMRPPEDWPEMLDVEGDIVAGSYLQMDYDAAGMSLRLLAYKKGAQGWDTLMPDEVPVKDIDAAGAGCMIVHRKVFEDPRMLCDSKYIDSFGRLCDLDDEKDRQGWAPPYFPPRFKPNAELHMTEDLPFCQKAKDLGYSVKLCQTAWFAHDKSIDLNRLATFVTKTAREAVARGSAEPEPYDVMLQKDRERISREAEERRAAAGALPCPYTLQPRTRT